MAVTDWATGTILTAGWDRNADHFDCSMKWIFAFLLAVLIFGGAALFSYKIFIRPELVMRAERKSAASADADPGSQPAGIPGRAETSRRKAS